MSARKRNAANRTAEPVSSEEKIARLLGFLAIKDIEQKSDQVLLLRAAGFLSSEVATLLHTTENSIAIIEHRARKKKTK